MEMHQGFRNTCDVDRYVGPLSVFAQLYHLGPDACRWRDNLPFTHTPVALGFCRATQHRIGLGEPKRFVYLTYLPNYDGPKITVKQHMLTSVFRLYSGSRFLLPT